MEHRDNQTPSSGQNATTGPQHDLTKAQSAQQPQSTPSSHAPQDASQPQPEGQSPRQPSDPSQQAPTGQADYGSAGQQASQSDPAGQSGTADRQRSDIEGGTATGQATDVEGSSSFVGSQSAVDTSSEMIEDDDSSDFARDGQGAVE